MTDQRALGQLRSDGFCLLEGVILADRVGTVRDDIAATVAAHRQQTEAEMARMRSRGHRVGTSGVTALPQAINDVQSFASYLADQRILALADAVFGPYVRISSTGGVVNDPGTQRGYWHADWPYNQTNASHIRVPYPDATMHLTTIWMLTAFTAENGGTLVVPGSHRSPNNPASGDMPDVNPDRPHPDETQVTGAAGSVVILDSRLWHAVAPNRSTEPRVALVVRYAPWWLNLNPIRSGTPEHTQMVVETGGKAYVIEPVKTEVYERLPEQVQPLLRHHVAPAIWPP